MSEIKKDNSNKKIELLSNLEDTDASTSEKSGIVGVFETLLRKFRTGSYLIALTPVYIVAGLAMGAALTPGLFLVHEVYDWSINFPIGWRLFSLACSIIFAFLIYGFCIIFIVPAVNFILPFRMKPFRGGYFSIESVPWYVHNALTYLVRYTFLEFVTPTPFNPLFYRMMGMKIGKGVHINTTNISDPALIEIGDKVTIGGSAHIIAHYASKGYIIVAPVKIGKGVTIGLKATIMGDVEIGDGAVIAPHEVILPKSRIPAGRKPKINE